jgi:hypothetical protein
LSEDICSVFARALVVVTIEATGMATALATTSDVTNNLVRRKEALRATRRPNSN